MYIWQQQDWAQWRFDLASLLPVLSQVHYQRGQLLGRMKTLGWEIQEEAYLTMLTDDVVTTSAIEGEILNVHSVRSSVAKRLGIDIGALAATDRHVDGVVEMILDATQNYQQPLTEARLFGWHAALFPTGYSGMSRIQVANWRNDADGVMEVVSGAIGRQKVHYQAPPAKQLADLMPPFLDWFNQNNVLDSLIKAGLAHLWFVTLHPFDDGNGRIARAIADMALARADQSSIRFYSLSAQIQKNRKDYYTILEQTQKGDMDVTNWLSWFCHTLLHAVKSADQTLHKTLFKAKFWQQHAQTPLNPRQNKLINRLLDDFEGKLTTKKWASIAKCSTDTALRDITELIRLGILEKQSSGGRSTHYTLAVTG